MSCSELHEHFKRLKSHKATQIPEQSIEELSSLLLVVCDDVIRPTPNESVANSTCAYGKSGANGKSIASLQ